MTREEALALLERREGVEPYAIEHLSEEYILAAAEAPEGQPCADCGQIVVYRDDDWRHLKTPTSCFLAREDER